MTEAVVVSVLMIAVLCAAPLVAHVSGWWVSRYLRVKPGAIREWMPSIPDHLESDGSAEERWEKRRRAVEAKLLRKFEGGVTGAEAQKLAAELGEDPDVVAGALGHMREEIPVRLRVTRSGALLHDFDASSIAELRAKRRMRWPAKIAIFVLGVLANLGAAWPVIMALMVAGAGLVAMSVAAEPVMVGGAALGTVAGLFVLNMFAGWFTHLLLTPGLGLTKRPKLGPTRDAEESYERLQEEQVAGWHFWDTGFGGGGSGRRSSSSSSSGDPGCGADADIGEGILVVIIVALLLAVIAACSAAIFVFLRGIWRAVTGAGMPPLDVSPTQWVRSTQPNDKWERFIPTNDLVLRVVRVLRRLVSHTHPRDSGIIGRVMAKARQQNGRIAALEIALQEGLDLDTATTIGAQLAGRAGGVIDVTDGGELDFVFPDETLTKAPAEWDDDMNAEYLDYHPEQDSIDKRGPHVLGQLPVNMPGIAWSHVKSASRLAAGTVLMMLTGAFVVSSVPDMPLWVKVAVDSFLPLLALGTFALAGVLRYVASTMAELGMRRDFRRMTFLQIRRALSLGRQTVNLKRMTHESLRVASASWKGADIELISKEITGVAVDLDLEPTADGGFRVDSIADRLQDIERHRAGAGDVWLELEEELADEVVFDSKVEHDRVRALA